ncbi:UNKNOWN [Stylonychia lemnae]|uniref:Thioesterase domain-containing protein n=1 Tax=Stylonychia lemnae TaxID=5949 RepID=A0A078B4H8_STYLE|nr:UNKNOWN [Stylonychia lemnae]|eukprot:CDW88127.1 UNKNOWN [Stylonychia lemnae]
MTSQKDSITLPKLTEEEVRKNFAKLIEDHQTENQPSYGRQFQQLLKLQEVRFEEGIVGKLIFTINIPKSLKNIFNITHGGAVAAIIDDSTWAAVYAFTGKYMYSMKLINEFMSGVPIEKDLLLEVQVNKFNKNLAFSEAVIRDPKTKSPLVKGGNVMAIPPEKKHKI